MSAFDFPWDNGVQPDFINEQGYEWYIDKDLTRYAQDKDGQNKPLKAVCFYVRKNSEPTTRVLIGENQQILHEDSTIEGMACKIDFLRLAANQDK